MPKPEILPPSSHKGTVDRIVKNTELNHLAELDDRDAITDETRAQFVQRLPGSDISVAGAKVLEHRKGITREASLELGDAAIRQIIRKAA